VPQSPNFPLGNLTARQEVLDRVTDMFRETFPYTTIYPALGNLDLRPGVNGFEGEGLNVNRRVRGRQRRPPTSQGNKDSAAKVRHQGHHSGSTSTSQSNPSQKLLSPSKSLYRHVADLWQTWLPPKAVDSLQKGGYYNIEMAGRNLRLVSLNMNVYLEEATSHTAGGIRRRVGTGIRRRGQGTSGGSRKSGMPVEEIARSTSSWVSDPEDQWAWLYKVMDEARRKKQNVILFGHSPPGKYERSSQLESIHRRSRGQKSHDIPVHRGQHWLQEKYNRRYLDFVRRYSDIIVGQFFGHQHSDSFRIFRDKQGKAVSWALLNPSVSPFRMSSGGGGGGGIRTVGNRAGSMSGEQSSNPAVRLYRYDPMTGHIYDYAQYYLDLKEANLMSSGDREDKSESFSSHNSATNTNPSPLQLQHGGGTALRPDQVVPPGGLWRIEYNFTSLYRLPKVTVESLDALSRRVANNKSWFDAYFRANAVSLDRDPSKCDQECRKVQTCAISNIDYAQYAHCVERGDGATVGGRAYDVITAGAVDAKSQILLLLLSLVSAINLH